MFFSQLPIAPPAPQESLADKTVLVTGANTGLGFAASRTFLLLGIGRLILAVRSTTKGEAARAQFLSDPHIQERNPRAMIEVFHLDLADYGSVLRCADEVKQAYGFEGKDDLDSRSGLDILVLNAGASVFSFQHTNDGHESMIQVNLLSNILLTFSLLPLLKATADRKSSQSRITWVGSRRYKDYSRKHLGAQGLLSHGTGEEGILSHFDIEQNWERWVRYNDSKFLAALFVRQLAERISAKQIVVNMCCPGMVNTGITKGLPSAVWVLMVAVMAIHARSREEGGWVVVRAALGDGESHGKFLQDGDEEPWIPIMDSEDGNELSRRLWEEAMDEMVSLDHSLHTHIK